MSDRELLRLAAKAIGLVMSSEWDCAAEGRGIIIGRGDGDHRPWNPLADDGEAIRIAVKLGMDIEINDSNVYAGCRGSFSQPANPDPCAALRRAIVMAAAEIGKAMP